MYCVYLLHNQPSPNYLLMRNNILGGLVIFMVVLTCLLMLDDISNTQEEPVLEETAHVEQSAEQTDLAVIEEEE